MMVGILGVGAFNCVAIGSIVLVEAPFYYKTGFARGFFLWECFWEGLVEVVVFRSASDSSA